MTEKYNIIVSSKNRDINESISNFTIKLEKPLVATEDEYFTVNMIQFNAIKAFYAVQHNLNSDFQIIIKYDTEPDEVYELFIPQGNYDVYTLQSTLADKIVVSGSMSIEYDEVLNKFLFKDVLEQEGYSVYLKCINSGVFFGMENGVETLITSDGVYSSKFINVSGYENMIINIGGVEIENSVTNIHNKTFQHSKILGIIPVNHIVPMDSITYDNIDGGINFNYKIHNKMIEYFNLSITNEDGIVFPQMSDYLITLQFSKHSVHNELKSMNRKLEDIAIFMTALMQKAGFDDE